MFNETDHPNRNSNFTLNCFLAKNREEENTNKNSLLKT